MRNQPRTRDHEFERSLRREQTYAEWFLWQLVRDRKFRGLKFRRQHRIGPYVLDFYCPTLRLGIELDGAHHFELGADDADDDRARVLKRYGVAVFHFENREILEYGEGILEWLANNLPLSGGS